MKVKLAQGNELPGGFVIEAEDAVDILFLRIFAHWRTLEPERKLMIQNHGGNANEGKYSILIGYGQAPKPEEENK